MVQLGQQQNSLPYTANNIASCGLAKTSVIGAVGRDGSSGNSGTNKSVTFDGTNFANGPNINTTRMFNNSSGAGTGTAALIVGGFIDPSPNAMTNCEEYDGSSWTATGTLNVATGFASAFGIQTNAVAQTNGSNYVETEAYDGSTWTTLPNTSVSSQVVFMVHLQDQQEIMVGYHLWDQLIVQQKNLIEQQIRLQLSMV